MNLNKLKGKFKEHEWLYIDIAKKISISESSIVSRMKGIREFKPSEISKLTNKEVIEIFFD